MPVEKTSFSQIRKTTTQILSGAFRIQESEINAGALISFVNSLIITVVLRRSAILLVATTLRAVDVEQIKPIHRQLFLLGRSRLSRYIARIRSRCLRQFNITLVGEELDLASFVLFATHHARAREEGIVHGVHADVGIAVTELDIYDDEVVDVLHVVAYLRFQETFFDCRADEQVASGTICDFIADVLVEMELAVRPFHFDLR